MHEISSLWTKPTLTVAGVLVARFVQARESFYVNGTEGSKPVSRFIVVDTSCGVLVFS